MKISQVVADTIVKASAKALATIGNEDVNVIPVSMVKVNDDSIWLFDFFMEKTVENIQSNNNVSLTCWTDMTGVQLKATAEYVTEGPSFDESVAWAHKENPERVVKGLLVLSPTQICDVSPGGVFREDDLNI